jgi:hypothetical protein
MKCYLTFLALTFLRLLSYDVQTVRLSNTAYVNSPLLLRASNIVHFSTSTKLIILGINSVDDLSRFSIDLHVKSTEVSHSCILP